MKVVKQILLYAYTVEYVDQREPKPRTLHRETVVLDRERVHALDLLGVTVPDWIMQQYAKQGFTVTTSNIQKAARRVASVDTAALWAMAAQQTPNSQTAADTAPAGSMVTGEQGHHQTAGGMADTAAPEQTGTGGQENEV